MGGSIVACHPDWPALLRCLPAHQNAGAGGRLQAGGTKERLVNACHAYCSAFALAI